MAGVTFKFDQEKANEVILYLASKVPVPNVYGICKILYLADKTSLEKYGRFLFGESYVAMTEGSTPSNAYNVLRRIEQCPTSDLKRDGNRVIALRNPNLDYLSQSDIECLDQTIAKYGNPVNWSERKRACHDDAWQKAWDTRGRRRSADIPVVSIAKTLKNSGELIDYLLNSG